MIRSPARPSSILSQIIAFGSAFRLHPGGIALCCMGMAEGNDQECRRCILASCAGSYMDMCERDCIPDWTDPRSNLL